MGVKNSTVLILDDNKSILNDFEKNSFFDDNNIQLFICQDLDDMQGLIEKRDFSAVIIDLNLTSTSSNGQVELISALRTHNKDTPILGFSSSSISQIQSGQFEAMNVNFFPKKGIDESVVKVLERFRTIEKENSLVTEVPIDRDITQELITDVATVSREWSKIIKKSPEYIHKLTSREFEEFVAEIWYKRGFDVTLTPRTRDGGKDIYAYKKNWEGEFLYAIECKQYSRGNKVGRPTLQQLYGVVESEKLSGGIIATTSYFSKDAIEFSNQVRYRLYLQDIQEINSAIKNMT